MAVAAATASPSAPEICSELSPDSKNCNPLSYPAACGVPMVFAQFAPGDHYIDGLASTTDSARHRAVIVRRWVRLNAPFH
jgi:hypothetical protein